MTVRGQWAQLTINYSAHIIMKRHVRKCSTVAKWFVFNMFSDNRGGKISFGCTSCHTCYLYQFAVSSFNRVSWKCIEYHPPPRVEFTPQPHHFTSDHHWQLKWIILIIWRQCSNLQPNSGSWHSCGGQLTQTIQPNILADQSPPPPPNSDDTRPPPGQCAVAPQKTETKSNDSTFPLQYGCTLCFIHHKEKNPNKSRKEIALVCA